MTWLKRSSVKPSAVTGREAMGMNRNLNTSGKLPAQTPEGKREMERKLAEIREMYRDDCDPNCSCQCPGQPPG